MTRLRTRLRRGRSTLTTLALVVFCGAGLAAQGAGTQPRPGVPVEKPAIDPSPEIIAIGCLAKEGDNYELRNSSVLIRPWVAPGLKPDAVGTPAPSPSKTVFRLMHKEGLEAHVGHKVEIAGVIQPQTANVPPSPDTIVRPGTGPGTATAPAATGAQGASGAQAGTEKPRFVPRLNNPELDNKPLKMVSTSCS
jgi:hypothetical protein